MKQHSTIQFTALLVAALPVVVFGGESARLTISGYVPPMQRIAAVQSSTVRNGRTVFVLQEQNNSALGYTLTVESKSQRGQPSAAAALQITFDGQPVNLTNNKPKFHRTFNRSAGQTAGKILEVSPPTDSDHDAILLTIASQ